MNDIIDAEFIAPTYYSMDHEALFVFDIVNYNVPLDKLDVPAIHTQAPASAYMGLDHYSTIQISSRSLQDNLVNYKSTAGVDFNPYAIHGNGVFHEISFGEGISIEELIILENENHYNPTGLSINFDSTMINVQDSLAYAFQNEFVSNSNEMPSLDVNLYEQAEIQTTPILDTLGNSKFDIAYSEEEKPTINDDREESPEINSTPPTIREIVPDDEPPTIAKSPEYEIDPNIVEVINNLPENLRESDIDQERDHSSQEMNLPSTDSDVEADPPPEDSTDADMSDDVDHDNTASTNSDIKDSEPDQSSQQTEEEPLPDSVNIPSAEDPNQESSDIAAQEQEEIIPVVEEPEVINDKVVDEIKAAESDHELENEEDFTSFENSVSVLPNLETDETSTITTIQEPEQETTSNSWDAELQTANSFKEEVIEQENIMDEQVEESKAPNYGNEEKNDKLQNDRENENLTESVHKKDLEKDEDHNSVDDKLHGDRFDNHLEGYGGDDKIFGHNGDDKLFGGEGDDLLKGGNHNDQLFGQQGSDHLRGDRGDDWLSGGEGNDYLRGGSGDDTLIGGEGNDEVYGDAGNDMFIFSMSNGQDYFDGGSWLDVIDIDGQVESISQNSDGSWLMVVDGIEGHMEADQNFNAETQSFDGSATGEITFEDGSSVKFTDVEKVNWDIPA